MESVESSVSYEQYRSCMLNLQTSSLFKYKLLDFTLIGLPDDVANRLLDDPSLIQDTLTSSAYDLLMYNKRREVLDNYVERNEYVRMLIGMPTYENQIAIENGTSEKTYKLSECISINIPTLDMNKRIYELDVTDVEILVKKNLWSSVKLYYSEIWVIYIEKFLTPFKVREMDEYGLLYIDSDTYPELSVILIDNYNKSLNYFKCVLANKVYELYLTNYEPMIMCYLLLSALALTIVDTANENFTIDFSDSDLITAILNSAGLPYIELPKYYLQPFIYSLEKMNREKGSKQVLIDLHKIFNINNIYRYLIYRKPVNNILDPTLTNQEKYDLYFVRVPVEVTDVEPYLANTSNHIRFVDMVMDDAYWGLNGDRLYDEIIEEEFNYYETKYISIENMFEFTKNAFEFSTIFNYVLYNKDITNNYILKHGRGVYFNFTLFEGFIYVITIILKLKKWNDVIPETLEKVMFVKGIDTNKNFKAYAKLIHMYLSRPEYEDILEDFIPIDFMTVDDVNEFMYNFCKNKDALRRMQTAIIEAQSYDDYILLKGLYDSITTVDAIKSLYTDESGNQITSYVQYLKLYNEDLYKKWSVLETTEDMQGELTYVINLMDEYMNAEEDPVVDSELDAFKKLSGEYGISTFTQLKTILKYYKYLTIELRDYSLVFKVDNLLYANREFARLAAHETVNIYKTNVDKIDIINHKNELLKLKANKSIMNVICIDDEHIENF